MAASIADGERLDASRVGDRRNRADKKKRPIDESTSPEIIDAFDRAVCEGADRFKRRKPASASAAVAARRSAARTIRGVECRAFSSTERVFARPE